MESLLKQHNSNIIRACIKNTASELKISPVIITSILDQHLPGVDSFYFDRIVKFNAEITFSNNMYTPASMGARKGEVLMGIKKVTKNAIFVLTGSDIPPSKTVLDEIRGDPIGWKDFVLGLSKYSFFKGMSYPEKVRWLRENEKDDISNLDYDIAEIERR